MNKIQIIIELNTDGSVSVTGALHDKILCYGLLELARQTIERYVPKEQSIIVKPEINFKQMGN